MTDGVDDLVADAESDLEPKFVTFSLDEFQRDKAMWAANYFVLWPLGLALTMTFDVLPRDGLAYCGSGRAHDPHATGVEGPEAGVRCLGAIRVATGLDVREWEYPEGELAETINQEPIENNGDFRRFLTFVNRRLVAMKTDERQLLIKAYSDRSIAKPEQVLLAADAGG